MKILLAVDGSECSDAAARAVGERPWPTGSEIRVVSVIDLSARMAGFTYVTPAVSEMLYDALAEGAETVIARAAEIVRERASPDLFVTTAVMHGAGPAASIVDEAADWGADLVVVGSHGRGAIGRFLLGSVSSSVVAHAPCSVEVVRCTAASPE